MKTPLLCSALVALLFGCGPLLQADLALEEWCQTMNRFEVSAAPEEGRSNFTLSGAWTLPQNPVAADSGKSHLQSEMKVALVRVEIHVEGMAPADYLTAAEVRATLDGEEITLARLAEIDARASSMRLLPPEGLQLASHLDGREVPVQTYVEGTLPESPWRMEVRACFRGAVGISVPGPASAVGW